MKESTFAGLVLGFSFLLLGAAVALAEDAPKTFDFQAVLTDVEGEPLRECRKWDNPQPGVPLKCEAGKDLPTTLGYLAAASLMAPEQNMDVVEQVKRWDLARKIVGAKSPLALETDEIELIKKAIAKRGNPLFTGQVNQMLSIKR